jgi:hypothetical protein
LKEVSKSIVPLNPRTFLGLLSIPKPTKLFKVLVANAFLSAHGGGISILKEWVVHTIVEDVRAFKIENWHGYLFMFPDSSNFQKFKRFFMASYLVFAFFFGNPFKKLAPTGDANIETRPIPNWYPSLRRHDYPLPTPFLQASRSICQMIQAYDCSECTK